MIIMGSALTFMTGAGIHALRDYKDVKLSAAHRNSTLQTWGYERVPSKVESLVGWNAHPPEGLGLDHEEWKKSKEQYKMMKLKESE
jgi:sulfite reductase beta subunit-like hemoprotein